MVLHLIFFRTNLFFSTNHLQIIKTSLPNDKLFFVFWFFFFLHDGWRFLIDNWLSCNSISEAYDNLNVDPNGCYRHVNQSESTAQLFRLSSNTRPTRPGSAHLIIVSSLVYIFKKKYVKLITCDSWYLGSKIYSTLLIRISVRCATIAETENEFFL